MWTVNFRMAAIGPSEAVLFLADPSFCPIFFCRQFNAVMRVNITLHQVTLLHDFKELTKYGWKKNSR